MQLGGQYGAKTREARNVAAGDEGKQHGKLWTYHRGCRCQLCTYAKNLDQSTRRSTGHGINPRLSCPDCPKTFTKESAYRLHYSIAHKPKTEKVSKSWSAPWMKPKEKSCASSF